MGCIKSLGTSAPNNYICFLGKSMALRILNSQHASKVLVQSRDSRAIENWLPNGSTMYFLNRWHANVVL